MKTKNSIIYSAVIILAGIGTQSCTNEVPFSTQGEGTVFLNTKMYSDLVVSTRAAIDDDIRQKLEDEMTIYLENSKGVIRKYTGVSTVESPMILNVGEYAIEGWTGDSVSADYDKKFYRGYQKFSVEAGESTQVTLEVNIANVIASIDITHLDPSVQDVNVTFNHTRASLDFDKDKIDEGKKGYFMMPNGDNVLHYKVEVTGADGKVVTEENDIKDVKRSHEYKLQLLSEQKDNDKGGALVKIEVLDIPVKDQTFYIYPGPSFKSQLAGADFDVEQNQIDCTDNNFNDFYLRVVAYYGLKSLSLNFNETFEDMSDLNGKNIWNNGMTGDEVSAQLLTKGISYEHLTDSQISDDNGTISVHEGWLRFNQDFFRQLPQSNSEYVIEVKVSDNRTLPISNSIIIRIANTDKALDNKLISSVEPPSPETSPMAILSDKVTLEGVINTDDAQYYGIMYRLANSNDEFVKVYAPGSLTRAAGDRFSVTIDNLQPGKTYEYKGFCDDYEEQKTRSFTTETRFEIPFGNMETWSKFSNNAAFPGVGNSSSFWDSGNHGSQLASKNLTTSNSSFINGNTVAQLKSQTIMTVLAAGNLFVGNYIKNEGTSGAQLTFGRPFDGSHPSALKVKVNYQPGSVDKVGSKDKVSGFSKGDNDNGQIFVAIASSQCDLNTAQGKMFEPQGDNILGYGEVTWNNKIGSDNELADINIPIIYNEKAKTTPATHIIIVCSASKYGDYFTGSSSSVMYVDDFELEYGEIRWSN
ncbi:MAG: PCMD domain-containing protein [Muribaculaceae bacterium]|nr:PCMD domain-containing protein [Muribaculaceae bacterium]